MFVPLLRRRYTTRRRLRSSRQGAVEPFTRVEGPSAWVAADYKDNEKWIYRLTPGDIAELDAAVTSVVASGKRIQVLSCHTLPC